jgi:hypothetical protein
MAESLVQRAFAAGEIAPALHARADLVKYSTGLRTCRNFFVRREGGVSNRAGLRFVGGCKTDDYGTRLARFVGSESGEGYLLEFGDGYLRFFQDGAPIEVTGVPAYNGATNYIPGDVVSSGGVNYYCHTATVGNAPPNAGFWYPLSGAILEIPTPYALDTIPNWNQSGNVITLTHPAHDPAELVFESASRWILRTISTAPAISPPAGLNGSVAGVGTRNFTYVVTAAREDTYEESEASASFLVANTIAPTETAPIDLTWTAHPDAAEYYVYCDPYENGVFGFIGTAASNQFSHAGQIPDFTLTPPVARILFNSAGNRPTCSANYQQRRFFANTSSAPDSIWGSRVGFVSSFGISSPLQDDDSVTFRLAGNNHHPVRHMVSVAAGLVLFTDGGEWTLTGGGGRKNPITPSSIDAEQETYVGVLPWARPVVVGSSIVYVQARGTKISEISFKQEVEGLAGRDLTIYASHLFERRQIYFTDYQQNPHSIVWLCDSVGRLIGLTYIPEQDIWGWHRHDTDGVFEDVCVVPEADQDTLYVIVRRTVGGVEKRYIERLEQRDLRDGFTHADMFFVDSGLSYSGAAADTFAGLEHLEGRRVAVIADGQVLFDGLTTASPTVIGGTVQLDAEYVNVHIGLNYQSEFETLDVDAQGEGIRDSKKRISGVALLVERSSRAFDAGPTSADYRTYVPHPWESGGLATDTLEMPIAPTIDYHGRVYVRTQLQPLTVIGIIPRAELGG